MQVEVVATSGTALGDLTFNSLIFASSLLTTVVIATTNGSVLKLNRELVY